MFAWVFAKTFFHFENMPVQYTEIFKVVKTPLLYSKNWGMQGYTYFSTFCYIKVEFEEVYITRTFS